METPAMEMEMDVNVRVSEESGPRCLQGNRVEERRFVGRGGPAIRFGALGTATG